MSSTIRLPHQAANVTDRWGNDINLLQQRCFCSKYMARRCIAFKEDLLVPSNFSSSPLSKDGCYRIKRSRCCKVNRSVVQQRNKTNDLAFLQLILKMNEESEKMITKDCDERCFWVLCRILLLVLFYFSHPLKDHLSLILFTANST